jgi:hypothetical protein
MLICTEFGQKITVFVFLASEKTRGSRPEGGSGPTGEIRLVEIMETVHGMSMRREGVMIGNLQREFWRNDFRGLR